MADQIYVLARNGDSVEKRRTTLESLPDTDRYGRAIFREDAPEPRPVDSELMKSRLASAVNVVRQAIRESGLSKAEVSLKFAVDAKVGVVFLGETGIEASIEVKFEFDLKAEAS